jgi:hypothetical protein
MFDPDIQPQAKSDMQLIGHRPLDKFGASHIRRALGRITNAPQSAALLAGCVACRSQVLVGRMVAESRSPRERCRVDQGASPGLKSPRIFQINSNTSFS